MTDHKKYQVNFADGYVLTNKRTKEFIISFLNNFLPNRREYTNSYEIPQFSDNPTIIFKSANELIEYLEQNKNEIHAIYWYNKEESKLRGVMCLLPATDILFPVLFVRPIPDTTLESNYLKDLMNFCNSTKGLIEYQTPAARDTEEFLQRIEAQTATPALNNSVSIESFHYYQYWHITEK
jgi:hypothetical protein